MSNLAVSQVYEIVRPTALMPSANIGQLNFSTADVSFSFLMTRADFERLGRKIARLLIAMPAGAPRRETTCPCPANETRRKNGRRSPSAKSNLSRRDRGPWQG